MLRAYQQGIAGLDPAGRDCNLREAVWIDLYRPMPEQIGAVEALGVSVPSLEDMAEIEISSWLYVWAIPAI